MVLKLLLHLFVLRSLVIDGLHNYKEPHRQTLPRSIQPQNREGASPKVQLHDGRRDLCLVIQIQTHPKQHEQDASPILSTPNGCA